MPKTPKSLQVSPLNRHLDSVNKCYVACKSTYQNAKMINMEKFLDVIMKHSKSLKELKVNEVITAFRTQNLTSGLIAINTILNKPKTVNVLVALLTDIAKVYGDNKEQGKELVECFFKNCDQEALDIMRASADIFVSLMNLVMNKEVKKVMEKIQSNFRDDMMYFQKLLNNKH